jgi:hypothetical protein
MISMDLPQMTITLLSIEAAGGGSVLDSELAIIPVPHVRWTSHQKFLVSVGGGRSPVCAYVSTRDPHQFFVANGEFVGGRFEASPAQLRSLGAFFREESIEPVSLEPEVLADSIRGFLLRDEGEVVFDATAALFAAQWHATSRSQGVAGPGDFAVPGEAGGLARVVPSVHSEADRWTLRFCFRTHDEQLELWEVTAESAGFLSIVAHHLGGKGNDDNTAVSEAASEAATKGAASQTAPPDPQDHRQSAGHRAELDQLEEMVREYAADKHGGRPSFVEFRDVASLRAHTCFDARWMGNGPPRDVRLVVGPTGRVVHDIVPGAFSERECFEGSVERVSQILEAEPEVDFADPMVLAKLLPDLFVLGWRDVGCPRFLEKQLESGRQVSGGLEALRRFLEPYCEEPRMERDGAGWRLCFYAFAGSGSVNRWEIQGHARTVVSVLREEVLPMRSYYGGMRMAPVG